MRLITSARCQLDWWKQMPANTDVTNKTVIQIRLLRICDGRGRWFDLFGSLSEYFILYISAKISIPYSGKLKKHVVCFLLGDSLASDLYMPTFRNTICSIFKGRCEVILGCEGRLIYTGGILGPRKLGPIGNRMGRFRVQEQDVEGVGIKMRSGWTDAIV